MPQCIQCGCFKIFFETISIYQIKQNNAPQATVSSVCTEQRKLLDSFVPDKVFNLDRKALSDTEIELLEKGLDFE